MAATKLDMERPTHRRVRTAVKRKRNASSHKKFFNKKNINPLNFCFVSNTASMTTKPQTLMASTGRKNSVESLEDVQNFEPVRGLYDTHKPESKYLIAKIQDSKCFKYTMSKNEQARLSRSRPISQNSARTTQFIHRSDMKFSKNSLKDLKKMHQKLEVSIYIVISLCIYRLLSSRIRQGHTGPGLNLTLGTVQN